MLQYKNTIKHSYPELCRIFVFPIITIILNIYHRKIFPLKLSSFCHLYFSSINTIFPIIFPSPFLSFRQPFDLFHLQLVPRPDAINISADSINGHEA